MKPFIIGISGGSGSGKTSFIDMIRKKFSECEVCIISQDDYYRPIHEQQKDHAGIENFDLPESIDHEAFYEDIKAIINGQTIQKQKYTFNNTNATPSVKYFSPAPIIVIEGIFVFYFMQIKELLDLKVFIHAKDILKVIRRIKRDKKERNYPIDDVLHRFEYHVMLTYEKYIKPYKEDVDIVINNNNKLDGGFTIFEGFLKQKLIDLKARSKTDDRK